MEGVGEAGGSTVTRIEQRGGAAIAVMPIGNQKRTVIQLPKKARARPEFLVAVQHV
jgi:hypothetical protein